VYNVVVMLHFFRSYARARKDKILLANSQGFASRIQTFFASPYTSIS